MLILERRQNEKILIGEEVQIVLIQADYQFARIGIEAPRHVQVYREEIYLRLLREKIKKHQNKLLKSNGNEFNLSINGEKK